MDEQVQFFGVANKTVEDDGLLNGQTLTHSNGDKSDFSEFGAWLKPKNCRNNGRGQGYDGARSSSTAWRGENAGESDHSPSRGHRRAIAVWWNQFHSG